MARIANKKTGKLTKQYRDPSVFHASTRRRSYRRKGTSTRRKRTSYVSYTTVNDPVANAIATVIVGGGFLALLMWLLPIFVPIVVGCILLWGVDTTLFFALRGFIFANLQWCKFIPFGIPTIKQSVPLKFDETLPMPDH